MAHDELAAMFYRNMTLQQQPVPDQPIESTEAKPEPEPEQEQEPIVYASVHYTHSAHVAHEPEPVVERERPSSEPPQSRQPSAEDILTHYGVNPATLSASQMELFKTAEDAQKERLIELWRICPPSNTQENPAVAWSNTTVQQEEMLAQLRYERQIQEDAEKQTTMSMDGTPLTPVQTGQGEWSGTINYTEPYMMSGYEEMARREYEESARRAHEEAVQRPKNVYNHFGNAAGGPTYRPSNDPVYNTDWAMQQELMENRYGATQMGGWAGDMEL
ncbi:hypothetical protein TruAng_006710 [Truncatella angustata]|nr:hypothetical protein TruAng_006710 [Truncatella angustata]